MMRITKLKPFDGFCAEGVASLTILGAAVFGIPVSTTHTTAGWNMGVGSIQPFSAVHCGGRQKHFVSVDPDHPGRRLSRVVQLLVD